MSHSDRDFLDASALLSDPLRGDGVTEALRSLVADALIVIPRSALPATPFFDDALGEDGISISMDLRLEGLVFNGTTVTSLLMRWLGDDTLYTFTSVQSNTVMGGYRVIEMQLPIDDVIASVVLILNTAAGAVTFSWTAPADEVFIARRVEIDPYGVTEIQANGIAVAANGLNLNDPPENVDYSETLGQLGNTSFILTVSSTLDGGWFPGALVDGVWPAAPGQLYKMWSSEKVAGSYLQADFGSPQSVTKFRWYPRSDTASIGQTQSMGWELRASNDPTFATFTAAFTVNYGDTYVSTWNEETFDIGSFRYWRAVSLDTKHFTMTEIQFHIHWNATTAGDAAQVPIASSDTLINFSNTPAPAWAAVQDGIVVVCPTSESVTSSSSAAVYDPTGLPAAYHERTDFTLSSSGTYAGFALSGLIDNLDAAVGQTTRMWASSTSVVGVYFQLDFGTTRLLQKFRWRPRSDFIHLAATQSVVWEFRGSNDATFTTSELLFTVPAGTPTLQWYEQTFVPTVPYRYYRARKLDTAGFVLTEIEAYDYQGLHTPGTVTYTIPDDAIVLNQTTGDLSHTTPYTRRIKDVASSADLLMSPSFHGETVGSGYDTTDLTGDGFDVVSWAGLDVHKVQDKGWLADDGTVQLRFYLIPWGSSSASVDLQTPATGEFIADPAGVVSLRGGFNINLETNSESQLAPVGIGVDSTEHRLIFNVDARGGEGRFPTCEAGIDTRLITSINGVKPDEFGNIRIDTDACFRIERAIDFSGPPPETNPRMGEIAEGHLSISNGCKCCSPCEDYATVYKLVRVLFLRVVSIHQRLGTAIKHYEHLGRLLDKVRDYVERSKVNFRVVQNGANIITLQVMVQTGESAFDRVDFDVTWPAGYTVTYLDNSGWIKTPGTRPRQINTLFSSGAGASWTHDQTLPKFSISWFNWTIKLVPNPDPGGTGSVVPVTVDINPTIELRRLEPNTVSQVIAYGPIRRKVTISYPTLPVAYGPSRQP